MALHDKISSNAAPYLQPGEQVQFAFTGQTKSGWFQMFGLLGLLIARPKIRPVVVTDRRIVAFQGSLWSLATAKGVAFEAPRSSSGSPPACGGSAQRSPSSCSSTSGSTRTWWPPISRWSEASASGHQRLVRRPQARPQRSRAAGQPGRLQPDDTRFQLRNTMGHARPPLQP